MTNTMLIPTKENIILTSIDVIDEFGIQRFSTKEIARRIGISEPAIFKYFKTKTDLILAVLDFFSYYDEDIIQTIKAKKLKPSDAIMSFVDIYGAYYDNYSAITVITQNYDLLVREEKLSEKVKEIIKTRTTFFTEMIKEAQKDGEISSEIDSEYLVVIIMGSAREWCLKWRISGKDFSLRERMLTTLREILKTFKMPS